MHSNHLRLFLFLIIFIFSTSITFAQQLLTGKVVAISDGDTFTLLTAGNRQVKIRLYGVDCPEKAQDFGTRAKQFTSDLAFSTTVTVEVKGNDRYGRTIGIANLPNHSVLNEELLKAGMAWHYKQYDQTQAYADLENQARANNIGLWVGKEPVAPWDFRKGGRVNSTKAATVSSVPSPSRSSSITSVSTTSAICGSPTKTTGRPCQRLVLGDGYCWQHR